MIRFTKCLNTLRRWFRRPERPVATSGETSVLFVLQSKSPKTITELSADTRISTDQLAPILAKLERIGRIKVTYYNLNKYYWVRK